MNFKYKFDKVWSYDQQGKLMYVQHDADWIVRLYDEMMDVAICTAPWHKEE